MKVSPCLVTKAIKNQQPFTPSKDVSHKWKRAASSFMLHLKHNNVRAVIGDGLQLTWAVGVQSKCRRRSSQIIKKRRIKHDVELGRHCSNRQHCVEWEVGAYFYRKCIWPTSADKAWTGRCYSFLDILASCLFTNSTILFSRRYFHVYVHGSSIYVPCATLETHFFMSSCTQCMLVVWCYNM